MLLVSAALAVRPHRSVLQLLLSVLLLPVHQYEQQQHKSRQ
jgi:hypothetical protein